MKSTGTLFLIPSPLTATLSLDDIPNSVIKVIKTLSHFIVESKKSSAGFLKLAGAKVPFELEEVNEHTHKRDLPIFLNNLLAGKDVGLLSDTGSPCVADPGTELVKLAHQRGIKVVALPGPSSILLALMSSGLTGQNFRFHGYLPKDELIREEKLKDIEQDAFKLRESQIFIETPYRIEKVLESIVKACSPELKVCVAINLREENELIIVCRVCELKKRIKEVGKNRAVVVIG